MWLDVCGSNIAHSPSFARTSNIATPQVMQRLQAQQPQLFQDTGVSLSPAASRLASRQRHLESPGWMSQQLSPSRPARHWTSQFLAQQTWNWLSEAFPGSNTNEASQRAALQQALREFSPGTHEHCKRVGDLTLQFANDLGIEELEEEKLEQGAEFKEAGMLGLQIAAWNPQERGEAAKLLRQGGKFHDIGKLAVPDQILHKPGPLTPEERGIIEMHPLVGEAILGQLPGFETVLPMVRHHHERWDGNGYVDQLKGSQIPVEAQLLSLSDTYDALTEERPYRAAMSPQAACQEILRQRGRQFDPELAESFVYSILSRQR